METSPLFFPVGDWNVVVRASGISREWQGRVVETAGVVRPTNGRVCVCCTEPFEGPWVGTKRGHWKQQRQQQQQPNKNKKDCCGLASIPKFFRSEHVETKQKEKRSTIFSSVVVDDRFCSSITNES